MSFAKGESPREKTALIQRRTRRDMLKQLTVGSTIVGGAASIPGAGKWTKPVIETVLLPAHGQTSVITDTSTGDCASGRNIELRDDLIVYREGDGLGIWTSNPAQVIAPGFVAINLTPSLSGTRPSDTIFWEIATSFHSFVDVNSTAPGNPLVNGNTFITQETGVGTVTSNPDSLPIFDVFQVRWRATITRPGCSVPFIRTISYPAFSFIGETPVGSSGGSMSTEISITYEVTDEFGVIVGGQTVTVVP